METQKLSEYKINFNFNKLKFLFIYYIHYTPIPLAFNYTNIVYRALNKFPKTY